MKWLIAIVFSCSILFLGYFVTQNDFHLLLPAYTIAFASFVLLYRQTSSPLEVTHLIYLGLAIRIALIPSWPLLSDDIYRFIWDGNMIHHGLNPFSALPTEVVRENLIGLNTELLNHLNSPGYYSIYPSVCQFTFWIATLFNGENWIVSSLVLKSVLYLFEVALIFVGLRWLKELEIPKKKILLYVLNPLVIIEVMGNVHFEGVMAFFLIASLYALYIQKKGLSGILMALSISTKLIPLMILPSLVFMRTRLYMKFWIALGVSLALLMGFIVAGFYNSEFFSSIDLYFRSFEFNASLYYLARYIGIQIQGYNMIASIGPLLALVTAFIILLMSWRTRRISPRHLPTICLYILTIYFVFATTIHPWYIITLVVLSVFTEWKYPIVWSFLVVLSYHAYSFDPVREIPWIILIEYVLLLFIIYVEIRTSPKELFRFD